MKELRFIEGLTPKGFKPDFESFLFNEERHRHLQSPFGWQSFYLVRDSSKKILASAHFQIHEGLAVSPANAPFGSVEFAKNIDSEALFGFLQKIEKSLYTMGATKIQLKNPPSCYRLGQSALFEVLLLNRGYSISDAKISSAIPVDKNAYISRIESWELRKLKQGKKSSLKFRLLDLKSLHEIYDFILACRLERQQSLSMTSEEIKKVVEVYPDRILLFAIYNGLELAAASISVRINARILYNFYSAHPRKFDSLSPVVALMNGMYSWSRKNQIEWIDLGTSALENHPNFSLLDFKIRLGGIPSAKFTFEKALI